MAFQLTNLAVFFLSQIKLQPDENEAIHTNPTIDKESKNIAETMMLTYKPNKIKTANIELNIILKNETPIYQTPRRLPLREQDIVEKQVNNWISEGIVEPCSSECASPVVVAKKKRWFS